MLFFDIFATPKKIWPHFFKFLAHFKAFTPLFMALSQKVSCKTFQNYQISMYNSNTDSLGLIMGVEVFFSLGHCSGALCQVLRKELYGQLGHLPTFCESILLIVSKDCHGKLTFSSVRAGGVCMISVDNIIIWTDIGWWILAQMVPLILTHTRRHAAATAARWMVSEL